MSKKIAILQSNYIPWKGYFDIINMVDEFVIFDSVQFTKNDWRNRNRIKTSNGLNWITIPVKHSTSQKINEIVVLNNKWRKKHWQSLKQNYSKSTYFKKYIEIFEDLYINTNDVFLSEINLLFIKAINSILGIRTNISQSSEYKLEGEKNLKLINICNQANASEYISGPAAKSYLNEKQFEENNIKVFWMDYSDYPEYNQLNPPFEHGVSILDLIFNEGDNAVNYMKSFKL